MKFTANIFRVFTFRIFITVSFSGVCPVLVSIKIVEFAEIATGTEFANTVAAIDHHLSFA